MSIDETDRKTCARPSRWASAAALGAFAAGMGGVGCGKPVEMSCLRVPSPVLISRVDRVGGHRAPATPEGPKFGATVEDTLTVESHNETHGNMKVQVTTTTHVKDGANKASAAVLTGTNAQKEVDFYVTDLKAGSSLLWVIALIQQSKWVGVEGVPARGSR